MLSIVSCSSSGNNTITTDQPNPNTDKNEEQIKGNAFTINVAAFKADIGSALTLAIICQPRITNNRLKFQGFQYLCEQKTLNLNTYQQQV